MSTQGEVGSEEQLQELPRLGVWEEEKKAQSRNNQVRPHNHGRGLEREVSGEGIGSAVL